MGCQSVTTTVRWLEIISMVIEWVSHDYPVYGRDGLLGGRRTLFPWLWVSLVSLVVAFFAFGDAYIHLKHRKE